MVNNAIFWGGFGIAVRLWQLGLEMRPLFNKASLWAYPLFGGVGASFGWWLEGVGVRQKAMLAERKKTLLEKRARRDERARVERARVEAKIDNDQFSR